jgi:hypothetical protein
LGKQEEKKVSNCLKNKRRFPFFPNRKEDIYTCDSHCPFVRGLNARHGMSGFYDELFIFKFLDLVWGGHEKVWKLVMVFEFFLKTNMGWGQQWEGMVIFFF